MQYNEQNRAITTAFAALGIVSKPKTHANRHVGANRGKEKGATDMELASLGGWKSEERKSALRQYGP
jgi:hypothetical protein